MKKQLLLLALLFACIISYTQYQQPGDSGKSVTSEPREQDSRLVTQNILNRYMAVMAFSEGQKESFTAIINGYIEEKAKLLPLLAENKLKYDSKQASYFKTLKLKLSGILKKSQWRKFMTLRPRPNERDSPLYYIYY